jgi:hypothetical protein
LQFLFEQTINLFKQIIGCLNRSFFMIKNKDIPTKELRETFKAAMEAAGMPIRIKNKGAEQLYEILNGSLEGKKLRLRTNNDYALMSVAAETDFDAPIPDFQNVDFVGSACVNPAGGVICHLIPSGEAHSDSQKSCKAWVERRGRTKSNSAIRIIRFGFGPSGESEYAEKYRKYLLPAVPLSPEPGDDGLISTPATRLDRVPVKPIELQEAYSLAKQIFVEAGDDPKIQICSDRIMRIVEGYLGKLEPDEDRVFIR